MKASKTIFCLLLLCSITHSQTTIPGGNVSGTWEAAGSPYLIEGEITIISSDTLLIEPGVDVIFQGHYKLIVNGWLLAEGTESDSILFTAADTSVGWHGIRFIDAPDSSQLTYCIVQYGQATGASSDNDGGGIFCQNSNPTIYKCSINNNSAGCGGGMYLHQSSPIITMCDIEENFAEWGAGICCNQYSNPRIISCIIYNNNAEFDGGGIYLSHLSNSIIDYSSIGENIAGQFGGGLGCEYANPTINHCYIIGNLAELYGAGIHCISSDPVINACNITGNSCVGTYTRGGGIFCWYSDATISHCLIEQNSASWGGGFHLDFSNLLIDKCTISENLATNSGGGVYFYNFSSGTSLYNCILWNDRPNEIHIGTSSNPEINFCDIQGGWPGLGNIDEYPVFVDTTWGDYRLQWDSPCIDTGDPDPQYNDPDGTQADMGAYYYDQSIPVRILLTPHNTPIEIPSTGGSFDYTIQATNIDPSSQSVTVWCDVTLPNGSIYGPVLGPVSITMGSEQTISRERSQNVPAGAPSGTYSYNAYAVAGVDTSFDSFTFTKSGSSGLDYASGWFNSGEMFDEIGGRQAAALSAEQIIARNYPNPFNPTTTISFQLPVASWVKLDVFDINGRRVSVGARHASPSGRRKTDPYAEVYYPSGTYEITFDGSGLPSGIYLYRLTVDDFTASGKMVLVK
ncbi:hypothetical protein CEE37_11325 [candidate division LCP-89 bacterium B3_LCP]|uniref:Right handed beta helix domain-containing protein n=1 Tax=candidate division LCP-89 bacterium B3_LCP TaxID=2012998 RepID=A0A532UY47_UNCL8|nr:MAG: hypothetical protein CEE37_11325 [candidate division LCP-89 bacterium B3_LCP]